MKKIQQKPLEQFSSFPLKNVNTPKHSRKLLIAISFIFATFLWLYQISGYQKIILRTTFFAANADTLKVYGGRNGHYSEKRSVIQNYVNGRNFLEIPLERLKFFNSIRFDFNKKKGSQIFIDEISITIKGKKIFNFNHEQDLKLLNNVNNYEIKHFNTNQMQGTLFVTSRNDAYFDFKIPIDSQNVGHLSALIRACILGLLFYSLLFYLPKLFSPDRQTLPEKLFQGAFLVSLLLAAFMALYSPYNMHPDEYGHFPANQYYSSNHWLPPVIGDDSIKHTYQSKWGHTRLDNTNWVNFFAGKTMWLADIISCPSYVKARLFNLLLFTTLALISFLRNNPSKSLMFLLISPQIWYIFSYSNDDAWPLTLSLFLSYYVYDILKNNDHSQSLYESIYFGSLIGLLAVEKKNYWAFILFILMAILIKEWNTHKNKILSALKKYLIPFSIALFLVLTRIGMDIYVNGFDRDKKALSAQERLAAPGYRPSDIKSNKTDGEMQWKAKGVPYMALFSEAKWHKTTFKSFFGVYAWMTEYSPEWYYKLMKLFSFLLLFVIFIWGVFKSTGFEKHITLAGAFCFLLIIGMSSYFSWTVGLQAQGRYLFPIIPVLTLVFWVCRKHYPINLFYGICGFMYILSLYSFINTGLANCRLQILSF